MARVTIEDCLEKIPNRFKLVLIAGIRARQLATQGKDPYVEWEDDKPTVVALREIAQGYIDESILEQANRPAEQENYDMSTFSL